MADGKVADGKATDWEAIEREYRAAQLSVSEIARQHGISHTAINKRAKRDGWTKNLAGQVRQEVSARLVSDGVSGGNARETIELAAARGVEVVRQHRRDIAAGRCMVGLFFGQLEEAAQQRPDLEDQIEAETGGDKTPARRNAMMRAVSLPVHAAALRDLTTALKTVVQLERQAFSLDEPEREDKTNGRQLSDTERTAKIAALLDRARTRGA